MLHHKANYVHSLHIHSDYSVVISKHPSKGEGWDVLGIGARCSVLAQSKSSAQGYPCVTVENFMPVGDWKLN